MPPYFLFLVIIGQGKRLIADFIGVGFSPDVYSTKKKKPINVYTVSSINTSYDV